jgi:hypothetical protein
MILIKVGMSMIASTPIETLARCIVAADSQAEEHAADGVVLPGSCASPEKGNRRRHCTQAVKCTAHRRRHRIASKGSK